jgi:hypothetical protein
LQVQRLSGSSVELKEHIELYHCKDTEQQQIRQEPLSSGPLELLKNGAAIKVPVNGLTAEMGPNTQVIA